MKRVLQFAILALFGLNGLYAFKPFTSMRNIASGERSCQPKLVEEVKVGLPEYEKSRGKSKFSKKLKPKIQLLEKCTGKSVDKETVKKFAKNHEKMAHEMAKVCKTDPQFSHKFNTQCHIAVQADNLVKKKKEQKKSKSLFGRKKKKPSNNSSNNHGHNRHPSTFGSPQQFDYNQQQYMSGNQFGNQPNLDYNQQQPQYGQQFDYNQQFGNQPNLDYSQQQPQYGQQFGYNQQFGNQPNLDYNQQQPQYGQQFGYNQPFGGQQQFGYNQQPTFGNGYNAAPMGYAQPYYGNPQFSQAPYPPMAYAQQVAPGGMNPTMPTAVATPVTPQAVIPGSTTGQIIGNNASQGVICACP